MKQLITLLGFLLLSSSLTQAQANCQDAPPDGLSPLAAYSLFYENFRNGEYEFALRYGKWMACAKPEQLQGNPQFSLEKQYSRLVKIYDEIGRTKEDPALRSAHVDTALTLLNESLELFGTNPESRYDIIFDRGRFYQCAVKQCLCGSVYTHRHWHGPATGRGATCICDRGGDGGQLFVCFASRVSNQPSCHGAGTLSVYRLPEGRDAADHHSLDCVQPVCALVLRHPVLRRINHRMNVCSGSFQPCKNGCHVCVEGV